MAMREPSKQRYGLGLRRILDEERKKAGEKDPLPADARKTKKHRNKKIRFRMIDCGFTQAQLADRMGMSPGNFSKKLSGDVPWTLDEIKKLCSILAIPYKKALEYFG